MAKRSPDKAAAGADPADVSIALRLVPHAGESRNAGMSC
jgi:hypothetical protein